MLPEHETRLDGRGYSGWACPDALSRIPDWDPDPAVVARNEAGLPLGALLRNDKEVIRLPAGPPARSALQVGRHRLDDRYELLRPGLPRYGLARLPCAARRR
jgi:hypothetical protein